MAIDIEKRFKKLFPWFEEELINSIIQNGYSKKIILEEEIVRIGEKINSIPLVLDGLVKVLRQDNNGQEILLYYLSQGEICSTTLACCNENPLSNVIAIAEEPSVVFFIPVHQIDQWMIKYPSWKKFVMLSFRKRFDELLETIDSIAFMKMDERLINYLKNIYTNKNKTVYTGTHQDIAAQLNTSREVISRLLKNLEREGKVKLARNRIDFSGICD